jgi:hypothetical protein
MDLKLGEHKFISLVLSSLISQIHKTLNVDSQTLRILKYQQNSSLHSIKIKQQSCAHLQVDGAEAMLLMSM